GERRVELGPDLPFAENLVGASDLGLDRRLGLHEIEALALALGLENTALHFGKLEQRNPVAIDEPQDILGAERPGHHLLERNDGAVPLKLELEPALRRIEAEGHRAALVTSS